MLTGIVEGAFYGLLASYLAPALVGREEISPSARGIYVGVGAGLGALKEILEESRRRGPEYRTGQESSQGVDMTVVSTFGAPAALLGNVQGVLAKSLGGETANIPTGAAVRALPLYYSLQGYGYALGASPEAMGSGGQWSRAGWAVWWDANPGGPDLKGWWVVQSTDVATTESVKRAAALASAPRPVRR